MEMQINSQLIRSERERRAWSQSHLASVSGLGLRTVQRIESTGAASYESAAAIAATFSMNVADLKADETPAASFSNSISIPSEAIAALRRRNKVDAVKVTRAQLHMTLAESKALVDAYLDANQEIRRSYFSGEGRLRLAIFFLFLYLSVLAIANLVKAL